MYRIIRNEQRIEKLTLRGFSELGLAERPDLQEWIVKEPGVLNEDLLIIQKEFAGFDGTDERLDLLALDEDGRLVLIENKTDDSGKDVVWQALKYASYCASLTKGDIVEIYQNYLDRYCGGGNAEENIRDFLEVSNLDEIALNPGSEQRIVLVASNFRKEVTSTALWLLSHGVYIQCFRMNIYEYEKDLFLVSDQIIPVPEIKDYTVSLAKKEADQKINNEEIKNRQKMRFSFWERALGEFKKSNINLYNGVNPTKDNWLNAGSGISGIVYVLVFNQSEARCEISINLGGKDYNKEFFNILEKSKEKIESAYGNSLIWDKMDNKKSCIIRVIKKENCYEEERWADIIKWMIFNIGKMQEVFDDHLKKTNKILVNKYKHAYKHAIAENIINTEISNANGTTVKQEE